MILRILLLICAVFISPSLGGMRQSEFDLRFEDKCFQSNRNDPYLINGQETPLSNTMENFIALAEKFEIANTQVTLKDELFYFIRNYVFENLQITMDSGGKLTVSQWKPTLSNLNEINDLWEPDSSKRDADSSFTTNDPFTDAEKCSLFYMISHSILNLPGEVAARFFSYTNTSRTFSRSEVNIEDYYPQEIGVVSVLGTDRAISLSRVLVGMYVGLNQGRKRELDQFPRIINERFNDKDLPPQSDRTVDPLYTLTMAEVLMMAGWDISSRKGLAPNGKWVSKPLGSDDMGDINGKAAIDGFCPMIHKQQNPNGKSLPAYSYSTVRGAADGLILGMAAPSIESKKRDTRLSQILRMYYSRIGVPVDQSRGDFYTTRVSFCNRLDTLDLPQHQTALTQQMKLYGFLVSEKISTITDYVEKSLNLYASTKNDIFDTSGNTVLKDYCGQRLTLGNPEDLPRKTNLDVFVIMDSRISDDSFETQQLIAGYLAKHLDLRYTGSRMTILLDQKVNTPLSNARIELKTVVADEVSSSCAACSVAQIAYESSDVERDQIILAIDQLLVERKANESKQNGANGKVVVYFNFETDGERRDNNRIQGRLERALRDFHLRHQDVLMYAVGLESEVLRKFARNDPALVVLAKRDTVEEVAKELYDKISVSPALLQYEDCERAVSESSATFENFVSPLELQHWYMPAKYFYKSKHLKVVFESQNGPIKVCHNRATSRPELEDKYCTNTSSTTGSGVNNKIEFSLSNPCQSVTKDTCSPFYFAVMGVNVNSENRPRDMCTDITDHWCNTIEDIKFKVSHDGIRCSGCIELVGPPVIVLLTTLLSYLMHKTF